MFLVTGWVLNYFFFIAILRKAVDSYNSEGLLAVYLSFPSGCQFHVLNPTINGQQIKINQIHTFPGPEVSQGLFSIRVKLKVVLTAPIIKLFFLIWYNISEWFDWFCYSNQSSLVSVEMWKWWMHCLYCLSESSGRCLDSCSFREHTRCWQHTKNREWRWSKTSLFTKYFLSVQISTKYNRKGTFSKWLENVYALLYNIICVICFQIYRRSTALLGETHHINVSVLRQRICMAVENEIQDTLGAVFVNDDEYLDAAEW